MSGRSMCGPCTLKKAPIRPRSHPAPTVAPESPSPRPSDRSSDVSVLSTGRRHIPPPLDAALIAATFPSALPADMAPCPPLPEPLDLYRDFDPARCLIALAEALATRSPNRQRTQVSRFGNDGYLPAHCQVAFNDLVAATSDWPRELNRTLLDRSNWMPGIVKPRIVLDMDITSQQNFSLTWRPETYLLDERPTRDFVVAPRMERYFGRPDHELLFIHDVGNLCIDFPHSSFRSDPLIRQIDGYLVWVLSRILAKLLAFLRENLYVRVERWLEVVEASQRASSRARAPLLTWRIYDVEARQLAEDCDYEARFEAKHGIHQDELLEIYAQTASRLDRYSATSSALRRRDIKVSPAATRDCIERLQANVRRRQRADRRPSVLPPDDDELTQPRVWAG